MKSIIDQAVDRFLGWKLPADFAPDAGITFKPLANADSPVNLQYKHEPVGTNLFTAAQAKAMFEHVLQLVAQPEQMPVNNAFLTASEMAAFNRFLETCEDGEGYDVPKSMMQRLAQIGVVRHLSRGIYTITEFGQSVIDPAPITQPEDDGYYTVLVLGTDVVQPNKLDDWNGRSDLILLIIYNHKERRTTRLNVFDRG